MWTVPHSPRAFMYMGLVAGELIVSVLPYPFSRPVYAPLSNERGQIAEGHPRMLRHNPLRACLLPVCVWTRAASTVRTGLRKQPTPLLQPSAPPLHKRVIEGNNP